ncbi:MAG: hypothetical protein HOM55_09825 [Proteobacteria bacterium]|jgi:uncharacterized protein YhdP|nr:hypothetical protein [Pseudomonadota bacterium]
MLRKLKILLLFVLSIVVITIVGTAVFFDQIEERKELLEQVASRFVGQPVSSDALLSSWREGNPQLLIKGLKVESIDYDSPDLSIAELAFEVNWKSLLRFWPKIERATVKTLSLRIESLAQGGVKIGGWLVPPMQNRKPPARLLRWIGDQSDFYVADSNIEWRRLGGAVERYTDINLVYALDDESRLLQGVLTSIEGELLLRSEFIGNPFQPASDWQGEFVIAAVGVGASDSSTGLSMSSRSGLGLLRIPKIEFTHLRDLLVVAGVLPRLGIWMQQANAQGVLEDFEVRFTGDLLELDSWDANATIEGVSFDSTEGTPAGNNLGARLQATSNGGLVRMDSKNVTLAWPQHFAGMLDIEEVKAELLWSIASEKTQFRISNGSVVADQGVIDNIDATVALQNGGVDGTASMQFSVPDVSVIKGFVPLHLSPKMLEWWANAFPRGSLKNGYINYTGPISIAAIRSGQGELSASVDAVGVDVDYGRTRSWPPIQQASARMVLDQDRLVVTPRTAAVYQSEVLAGEVIIEGLFERRRVLSIVDAQIAGPAEDAVSFLLEGPLFEPGNRSDIDVTANAGRYSTRFSAEIPLANLPQSTVQGTGQAENGELVLPSGLIAGGINASVEYTEKSVSGTGEVDDFVGGKAQLSLQTLRQGRPMEVQLTASGKLIPIYLSPILGEPLANSLSGETEWSGTMNIGAGPVTMRVESELFGLIIALPEPVYKGSTELSPLLAEIEFAPQGLTTVRYQVGENLRGLLKLRAIDDVVFFEGGDLVYGQQPLVESFPSGGLGIRVQADEIDLDPWLDYMIWVSDNWPELEGDASSFVSALHRAELVGEKVRLFGKQLGRLDLMGLSNDGLHWAIDVSGDSVEGQLEAAPANEAPFYIADFKFLNWPASESDLGSADDDLKPYDYPIVSIHADDFQFSGRELGELSIVARPVGEAWNIVRMDMIQPALNILATGIWEPTDDGQTQTSFDYKATTPETGEALSALALGDFLDDGGLDVEGSARWPGPPSAFVLENLDASYKLVASRGKLVGVDPKAGRLLGLLNINSLSRRLRLDFSDIFSDGFAFDNLGSQGTFYDGNLALQEFYVVGPSAYMQSQGRIGIAEEDYDLELVVSPQLGGNIALLSAFANPAAGAVLYIAQRLFRDQLNDALRYSYTISGSWDEPEIKSTRIEPDIPITEPAVDGSVDLLGVQTEVPGVQ